MSGEYVPTTEEIREYVANGGEYRPWDAPDHGGEVRRTAAFDRWLTTHDARIASLAAEKALRDAADSLTGHFTRRIVLAVGAHLTAEADRIAAERYLTQGPSGA